MFREVAYSSVDVLRLPALLSVIGIFLTLFTLIGFKNTRELPRFRYVAFFFYAAATAAGWYWLWKLLDPSPTGNLYRRGYVVTQIMAAAHWVAFLGPLGLLVAAVLIERRMRKVAKENEY